MYHPSASQRLVAVRAMLDAWNRDADGYRAAAVAMRRGEEPSQRLLNDVEATHDGLIEALAEIERMLGELRAGDADFPHLLLTHRKAIAVAESIGNSMERLDRFALVASPMVEATSEPASAPVLLPITDGTPEPEAALEPRDIIARYRASARASMGRRLAPRMALMRSASAVFAQVSRLAAPKPVVLAARGPRR